MKPRAWDALALLAIAVAVFLAAVWAFDREAQIDDARIKQFRQSNQAAGR